MIHVFRWFERSGVMYYSCVKVDILKDIHCFLGTGAEEYAKAGVVIEVKLLSRVRCRGVFESLHTCLGFLAVKKLCHAAPVRFI